MYEIVIRAQIAAPIERVFDALADHERFFRGRPIERCVVTTPGTPEKNGLGAVREVDVGGNHYVEEVVRFERPRRFDYLVRSVTRGKRKLPVQHELGWLELTETSAGTRIDWRSRFRFRIPLLGLLLERVQGPKIARVLERLLAQAKSELEAAP
ncbi:MAG: SRPBCC family protein [Acidobacteriota bacterium]